MQKASFSLKKSKMVKEDGEHREMIVSALVLIGTSLPISGLIG